MKFSTWLEIEEKDFNFYRNLILGKLSLKRNEGLSQRLNTWEPDQLIGILNSLGEFKSLPESSQEQVIGQIRSGAGTLEDLIRIMSSSGRELGESAGFELYSWLSPSGEFKVMQIDFLATHSTLATQLTGLKYPLNMSKLYGDGWQRITYYGYDIYSNNPTIAPNERQKKALINAAKKHNSQRIIWDNDDRSPVIWHADYD